MTVIKRVEYDTRREVAKAFVPNPAGLPHIRTQGGKNTFKADTLRWSAYKSKPHIGNKARRAERAPRYYPEIFSPSVEIPITITIKSLI